MLFRLEGDSDYKIIDGLQRTTAILDFLDGRFKIFDKFSFADFGETLGSFDSKLILNMYTFENWKEIGKFYIDMNENITHSKADIQKAKDWFLAEHSIEL